MRNLETITETFPYAEFHFMTYQITTKTRANYVCSESRSLLVLTFYHNFVSSINISIVLEESITMCNHSHRKTGVINIGEFRLPKKNRKIKIVIVSALFTSLITINMKT